MPDKVGDVNFGEAMMSKNKDGAFDKGSSVQPTKPENFQRPAPAKIPPKNDGGSKK